MNKEEQELAVSYLKDMKESYVEGNGYEQHPLPEYYAIETAIKALKQEPMLDKIRAEIIQSIQNGLIKIETGSVELFRIIDQYKIEMEKK